VSESTAAAVLARASAEELNGLALFEVVATLRCGCWSRTEREVNPAEADPEAALEIARRVIRESPRMEGVELGHLLLTSVVRHSNESESLVEEVRFSRQVLEELRAIRGELEASARHPEDRRAGRSGARSRLVAIAGSSGLVPAALAQRMVDGLGH
jgi:hypothetical protein